MSRSRDPRTWARFTVEFPESPKIIVLSDGAFRTLVEMILWSRQQLTDGCVPQSVAHRKWNAECIAELMRNAMHNPSLSQDESGDYHIHGFLDHQESAEDVKSRSKRASAASRARWGADDANRNASGNAERNASCIANRNASGNAESESESDTQLLRSCVDARDDEPQPRRKRKAPETPIPDDWTPTDAHRKRAADLGVDIDHEAQQFRAHAEAHDRRCVRWNAAFTQWLGNAHPRPHTYRNQAQIMADARAQANAATWAQGNAINLIEGGAA